MNFNQGKLVIDSMKSGSEDKGMAGKCPALSTPHFYVLSSVFCIDSV